MRVRISVAVAATALLFGIATPVQAAPAVPDPTSVLQAHGLSSTSTPKLTGSTVNASGVAVVLPSSGPTTTKANTTSVASSLAGTTLAVQTTTTGETRITSIAASARSARDVTYRFPGAVLQDQRRCLQMKFAYPILPGYITYHVVSC